MCVSAIYILETIIVENIFRDKVNCVTGTQNTLLKYGKILFLARSENKVNLIVEHVYVLWKYHSYALLSNLFSQQISTRVVWLFSQKRKKKEKMIGFSISRKQIVQILIPMFARIDRSSDRVCYPKYAYGRVSPTGERANGKRSPVVSFTVEGTTDQSRRRYRSSLLATCSYASRHANSRRLIGIRVFYPRGIAYFIFEETHVNDRVGTAGQVRRVSRDGASVI